MLIRLVDNSDLPSATVSVQMGDLSTNRISMVQTWVARSNSFLFVAFVTFCRSP
jgi:hypothetical protein